MRKFKKLNHNKCPLYLYQVQAWAVSTVQGKENNLIKIREEEIIKILLKTLDKYSTN